MQRTSITLFVGILSLVTFVAFILIGGCSIMSNLPVTSGPCIDLQEGESFICEYVSNPQDLDLMLRLANVAALKKDLYKAESALRSINDLIATVESGGLRYSQLYTILYQRIDPMLFVILDDFRARFVNLNIEILPADTDMILRHLNKQKTLVLMAIPQSRGTGLGNTISDVSDITPTSIQGTSNGRIMTACKPGCNHIHPGFMIARGGAGL